MTFENTPGATVRKLLASESFLLAQHFLRLDPESRRMRFAHAVNDGFIRRYAATSSAPGTVVYAMLEEGIVRAAVNVLYA